MTGPGPVFTTRHLDPSTAPSPDAVRLLAHEDSIVLTGWHDAATTVALLTLVSSPSVVPSLSAAQHAAQRLEDAAPGTAALCGLARALHLGRTRSAEMVRAVLHAARTHARPGQNPDPVVARTFGTVLALEAALGPDPIAVTPLFLPPRRLAARSALDLPAGVPALVVDGKVEVGVTGSDLELTVGGPFDGAHRDLGGVRRFTDALRTAPPASGSGQAMAHRAAVRPV